MRFILYVRLGCHLCETATATLCHIGLPFTRVDIDRDSALQKEYGALVPVLKDCVQDCEWIYPFSEQDVHDFTTLTSKEIS